MKCGRGYFRPMPEDFREHARESVADLAKRYHAGQAVITRWKELCGARRTRERSVVRRDDAGNEKRFRSIKEAAQETFGPWDKGARHNIHAAIRRGGKSGGYWWDYPEDEHD